MVLDLLLCSPQPRSSRRSLWPRPPGPPPAPRPRPLPRGRASLHRPLGSGTSRRAWRTRPGAAGERSPREKRSLRGRRRGARGCRGVRPPGGTPTLTTATTTPSSSRPRASEADRASGTSGLLCLSLCLSLSHRSHWTVCTHVQTHSLSVMKLIVTGSPWRCCCSLQLFVLPDY